MYDIPMKSMMIALVSLMTLDVAIDDTDRRVPEVHTVEAEMHGPRHAPNITVRAVGRADTQGWSAPALERVRADRGRLILELTAVPPSGTRAPADRDLIASRILSLAPGQVIREVRVKGAEQDVTVEVAR